MVQMLSSEYSNENLNEKKRIFSRGAAGHDFPLCPLPRFLVSDLPIHVPRREDSRGHLILFLVRHLMIIHSFPPLRAVLFLFNSFFFSLFRLADWLISSTHSLPLLLQK